MLRTNDSKVEWDVLWGHGQTFPSPFDQIPGVYSELSHEINCIIRNSQDARRSSWIWLRISIQYIHNIKCRFVVITYNETRDVHLSVIRAQNVPDAKRRLRGWNYSRRGPFSFWKSASWVWCLAASISAHAGNEKALSSSETPRRLSQSSANWELFLFASNLSGASVINVHMSSITWHYSILAGNSILIVSFHAGWHGKWWLTSNIVMERFILPRVWRTVSYRWRFCVAAVSKQNCTHNDCLQTGFLSNPLVCYWLDEPNL